MERVRPEPRHYCPSNMPHEIGRRTAFGVPAATCDLATPVSARLINGDDVGDSGRPSTRRKSSAAARTSSLAIVLAWLTSDIPRHATISTNA